MIDRHYCEEGALPSVIKSLAKGRFVNVFLAAQSNIPLTSGSVRLRVQGLVQGHVHDFHLPSHKSRDGEILLHDHAYCTLNHIPVP